ncbi:hypothetical protein BT63DRAFT_26744 [Microthyrium microscopicum]|uniref:beta-galactosidase n=1 Tax=Microthyrium microscopicum TaxID=703497 RepID=A0A6A6UUB7_9PEZI|nr:hypothetical protein BT63DRAFT_26744 [Microthyrium microscopicum]
MFGALLWIFALIGLALSTDDGLTDKVSWDKYSLMVNGERVFIFAGEFHYQRLPIPELWLDVFQKFKANGMNAVSIYFFWSYHSPNKDTYDLTTGARDVQRLLDYAKQAGLYVIARPGPYCNAETSAGGVALWTTNGSGGRYRTADARYRQAWAPWLREVGAILKRNQITENGTVILLQIENELEERSYDPTDIVVRHMEDLKQTFRKQGMVIPTMHNEKGMRSISWSTDYKNPTGVGTVNMYGLDSYPGGFKCTKSTGFRLVRNYYDWFKNYSFTQPSFQPEFEAGWFQPWGGQFYDECTSEHSPEYADLYYKNNLAQRVTLLSLYMAYGGTSWGHSAAPVVYTSYDYSAPLRETRQVLKKFKQTKLIALFTRVSKDLLMTDLEDRGPGKSVGNSAIYTWILRNPTNKAGFYFLQQDNSQSQSKQTTSVNLKTSLGTIAVPNVIIDGRQSKILVTDYNVGPNFKLLYATADVLTYGQFPYPVLVMYLKQGQSAEFAFGPDVQNATFKAHGAPADFTSSEAHSANGTRYTKYLWTQPKGQTVVDFSDPVGTLFKVFLLDIPTAWSFFAPAYTLNPNVKPTEHMFVLGPYLVRSATIFGSEIQLTGDKEGPSSLEVFAGDVNVDKIVWNGKALATTKSPYGSFLANLDDLATKSISLPTLSDWKVADSLPEIKKDFDDTKFVTCGKSLHSSDYGFHAGIKIYRATFTDKSAVKANITVQGGTAAGWSAWLNGKLVGGSPGSLGSASTTSMLDFKKVQLEAKNVLTVVTDYTGHDQASVKPGGPANPRGILNAKLLDEHNKEVKVSQWKIQGNLGGEKELDHVRGNMNEGGLYGERAGWHLPGFDASSWTKGSPTEGILHAGVSWYITKFKLNIPSNMDVPIGVEFNAPKGTTARIQMFVNGYQYGKYVPHIGPQTQFPLQPGILNTNGENTLALSLWAQNDVGAKLSEVKLITYGQYETGFNFTQDWSYLQPGINKGRLELL